MKGPVVLLGPSGAGKSSAGRLAARSIGMRFLDLDDVVGDPARIFRDEGEGSFRARELAALERVLDGSDVLVAAGAGVVDSEPARVLLRERALCVHLDVDDVTALARLSSSPRPWLPPDDAARATAYRTREAPRVARRRALARDAVDGEGPLDAVAALLARAVDTLAPVAPASLLPEVIFDERLAFPDGAIVVVEDTVARAYPDIAPHLVLPGGDANKTLAHVEDVVRALAQRGLARDSVVVAVGGGAFLDAVGLACALAMRGVRWWAVPTTLLAQADAGVGGKTAVNLDGIKNLIGAFHPPEQTLIARRFRDTLGDADVRAGRAEMLKHEMLAADAPADGSGLIHDDDVARSLSIKLSVIRRDPLERGLRTVLNLGHTVAHGLEATAPIAHGEAVRFGLLAMLRLSVDHAGLNARTASALEARVRDIGPLAVPRVDPEAVTAALRHDKKGGRFVLLARPGIPRLVAPPAAYVAAVIRAVLRGA